MKKDVYTYPVVIMETEKRFIGFFPDIEGSMFYGDDINTALSDAYDFLGFLMYQNEGSIIPTPIDPANYDNEEGESTIRLITVFMPPIRKKYDSKAISEEIIIPIKIAWELEKLNIKDYSNLFIELICEKYQIII